MKQYFLMTMKLMLSLIVIRKVCISSRFLVVIINYIILVVSISYDSRACKPQVQVHLSGKVCKGGHSLV